MIVQGRCLCGAVRFEVDEPFDHFLHCHCSRCKTRCAAHATNAVVKPEAFRWIAGEDNVQRYDLPAARSFAHAFCKTCGSTVPHLTRSKTRVIVPAGALDEAPDAKPTVHAYWADRAAWFEIDPDLPKADGAAF